MLNKSRMKAAVLSCFFFMLTSVVMAQNSKGKDYYLVVGTYANEAKTNGIHVYTFNTATGDFQEKSVVTGITNPSYLAISKDRKNLYAISEAGPATGLNAYAFDVATGKLTFLNSGSSGGNGPCYVSVDDKKQWVFTGNYGGGSLSATKLNADGSLSKNTQVIQHEGSGVNKGRQEKPHVHSVVLSPDNRFLMVPDLGTDKVNSYAFHAGSVNPLQPATPPFVSVNPGGGPRHLVFHPNGKHAYLVLEMEGAVAAFDYNAGKLTPTQTITMLADDFNGRIGAADIQVSADGKFLYASNRGDANDISIYSIERNGRLTYVGRQGLGISNPRNFSIDPTGNFVLVGNQNGNDIAIFRRDSKTGMLTPTKKRILVDKPVCLKFVAMD